MNRIELLLKVMLCAFSNHVLTVSFTIISIQRIAYVSTAAQLLLYSALGSLFSSKQQRKHCSSKQNRNRLGHNLNLIELTLAICETFNLRASHEYCFSILNIQAYLRIFPLPFNTRPGQILVRFDSTSIVSD